MGCSGPRAFASDVIETARDQTRSSRSLDVYNGPRKLVMEALADDQPLRFVLGSTVLPMDRAAYAARLPTWKRGNSSRMGERKA